MILLSLYVAVGVCACWARAMPTAAAAAGAAAERFYDERLAGYVERIAEQIVDFNAHHRAPHRQGHAHHAGKHHHPHPLDGDDEQMQSDQPQPGHQSDAASSYQEQLLRREQAPLSPEDRNKQAMRNNIRERVLLFIKKDNGSKSYGEWDRSFYASCDQPKSTEENDDFMKLYFTLSQLEDTIASANLRLYRKSPNNSSFSDGSDIAPCDASAESEKLYRVTLYYHVKGQKKHKLKRKIGDSRVITESMPYVNLNVLQGVRELNRGKLFGVLVQIEDQFGAIVKAGDFFKGPNCTVGMPTPQALPTVFEEAYANLGRAAHPADLVRRPVQPKLDVKTIQTPPPDADAVDGRLGPSVAAATRCRHVQLRHAHGHHQQQQQQQQQHQLQPQPLQHFRIPTDDMNELRLLLDRIQHQKAQQQQDFTTTT